MKWSNSGTDFVPAPAGTHTARCVKIIDIGTQKGEYKGQVTIRRQCILSFELPNELMDTGKPFLVSRYYTASLHEKSALRHDLEMWRGRAFTKEELLGFDSSNVLGKPCMVTVVHTETGKAKVASITAMPRGMQCPPQVNTSVIFSLDNFQPQVFESLSDGLKKLIAQSSEYAHLMNPSPHGPAHEESGGPLEDMDDDILF